MKLHELLAVEGPLKAQANATRTDLMATFKNKRHLFEEKLVTFYPNTDGAKPITESQSLINTNVRKELAWIAGILTKQMDVSYLVAEANASQMARADVTLEDGTILLKSVPTTALLELEKRANEIRELITAIPTLDPAKGFTPDTARGNGIYAARERRVERTRKAQRPIVLYDATPEHPAQTQLISEDVAVGHVEEQEWSGLITPAEKGELLERAETFSRAVKAARMRANDADFTGDFKIGAAIFNYVLNGKAKA